MPFTATVDDRQYQVIASHADDPTGSVRLRIRLSGKKEICCNWYNGYTFFGKGSQSNLDVDCFNTK